MEAVDVVFDGVVNGTRWWILHIEPTGAVTLWRLTEAGYRFQRILDAELALGYGLLGGATAQSLDNIIASLDIEGLYKGTPIAPVGGVGSLSEIQYKVVQVSG